MADDDQIPAERGAYQDWEDRIEAVILAVPERAAMPLCIMGFAGAIVGLVLGGIVWAMGLGAIGMYGALIDQTHDRARRRRLNQPGEHR